ncbi:MAG: dihydrofolate reductase family protein [Bacteroidota bacterium]
MDGQNSPITIHMVCSLDGFIAKTDGDISWMHRTHEYEKGVSLTEEDIAVFLAGVDCYLMGSKTYEHVLELGWPYGDTPVFVLTKRELPSDKETVSFISGDLQKLIEEKLKPTYQNIWMVGGAELTKDFLQKGLADEIVITIMPVILGKGLLFFDFIGKEIRLELIDHKAYKEAMVELTYQILRE